MLFTIVSLVCALAMAGVHLATGRLHGLEALPRRRALSLAGGVAVAYVFLHVLPDLAVTEIELGGDFLHAEMRVFFLAFLGLITFYLLEGHIRRGRKAPKGEPDLLFWIHIAAFAAYNALVGYLLVHRPEQGLVWLLLYAVALGLHFITNDFALRHAHPLPYQRIGRFVLAGAVMVGWFTGVLTDARPALVDYIFAFLAGGVILNVLKEELPAERQGQPGPFLVGAGVYGVLLILVSQYH